MPFELPPRRSPGDVIRSGEWNVIIDDLEDLNTRLTNVEEAPRSATIIGFATVGLVVSAGNSQQVQPYSASLGSTVGFILPATIRVKNMYAYVVSNTLDEVAYIRARRNETNTVAEIEYDAGQTGMLSVVNLNVQIPAGDRIDFEIDTTAASSGNINVASVSIHAEFV